jgi:chromosome segregation ATPase
MADEPNNIVLEHLRHIRRAVDRLELDLTDVKSRVSVLEQVQGQILTLLGTMNQRMDRFEERLGRIERRLDLAET